MKRSFDFLAMAILAALLLVTMNPSARAGRIGGPTSTTSFVPAGASVYYDIPFKAGEQAVVTINGSGRLMYLLIYDTDGHVVVGTGALYSKTATMDVYRTGVFRVEVRNLNIFDSTFTLTTN